MATFLNQNSEMIRFAVKQGENVMETAGKNTPYPLFTPLHFAALNCDASNIQTLLELGANKNAKDAKGRTPWKVAKENCLPQNILKLLD